jgi:hypothetical protein
MSEDPFSSLMGYQDSSSNKGEPLKYLLFRDNSFRLILIPNRFAFIVFLLIRCQLGRLY